MRTWLTLEGSSTKTDFDVVTASRYNHCTKTEISGHHSLFVTMVAVSDIYIKSSSRLGIDMMLKVSSKIKF